MRDLVLAEWDRVIAALEVLVARYVLVIQQHEPTFGRAAYIAAARAKCDEYRALLRKARAARDQLMQTPI